MCIQWIKNSQRWVMVLEGAIFLLITMSAVQTRAGEPLKVKGPTRNCGSFFLVIRYFFSSKKLNTVAGTYTAHIANFIF